MISCNKERNTTSDTFFINSTQHVVKVNAYVKGVVDSKISFELASNETKKVYHVNTRGINHGISYGYINMPVDSFVVSFDNTYSIVHYKSNLISTNPKRYMFDSKRNIYNDSSYALSVKNETEIERDVEFSYVFTDQDYIDAQ